MSKKTIITVLCILVVVAGLFAWGYVNKGHTAASVQGVGAAEASVLTADKNFYDFGNISMKDGVAAKDFTITNLTSNSVRLTELYTSCMCTRAYIAFADGSTLGPFGMEGMGYIPPVNRDLGQGQSATLKVVFDPNAHGPAGVGPIDRFAILKDADGGELHFEIKAVVTP